MDVKMILDRLDGDFFTGVPDSALGPLCDFLLREKGISTQHLIAANEGNCVGLAAGAYLATGKIPVVYLQNSGIGNLINPVASLLNDAIYGIPCLFLVGWRGEPGTRDEPQHVFQGKVTLGLLEAAGITPFVIGAETDRQGLAGCLDQVSGLLAAKKQVALVFRRDALDAGEKALYANPYSLPREQAIRQIAAAAGPDALVASTGKISRELFELREGAGQPHCQDFLTVGSMGHTSSIALGLALRKPAVRVWCLEGDGSFLMHMGAAAVAGSMRPKNLVHVVLNNQAHESVGGMPTPLSNTDLRGVARACGYEAVYQAKDSDTLAGLLEQARGTRRLTFLEVKVAMGSRQDLGRPTIPPKENAKRFMEYLEGFHDLKEK